MFVVPTRLFANRRAVGMQLLVMIAYLWHAKESMNSDFYKHIAPTVLDLLCVNKRAYLGIWYQAVSKGLDNGNHLMVRASLFLQTHLVILLQ